MAIADPPIPFDHFPAHITRLGEVLEQADWSDLWREKLREIVIEGQAENFVTQTDPSGQPWLPRRHQGDPILDRGRSGIAGHPILTDLGELCNTVINVSDAHHVETVSQNEFSSGTNLEYAYEHEYGEGQAERNFIGIRDEYIDRLEEAVAEYAEAFLAGA